MKLLNIGGHDHSVALPVLYDGWDNIILDLNPKADLCMDIVAWAKTAKTAQWNSFDAIYISHTLEHIDRWDLPSVIEGIDSVLNPEGWVHVIVPDLESIAKRIVENPDGDIQLYVSPAGPITALDLLYGYSHDVKENNTYRHLNAFTSRSLVRTFRPFFQWRTLGFAVETCEIHMMAYKSEPANPPSLLDTRRYISGQLQKDG